MVVCKFFMQGNCRYGNSCIYDHYNDNRNTYAQQGSNYRPQQHHNYYQQHHQQQQQQYVPMQAPQQQVAVAPIAANPNAAGGQPQKVETPALLKSVHSDMTSAEKGGQWLLTCYAPFKDKVACPGFEDVSFEEIRSQCYAARHDAAAFNAFQQELQSKQQTAVARMRQLQSPNQDVVQLIVQIYNSQAPITVTPGVSGNFDNVLPSGGNIFALTSGNTNAPTNLWTPSPQVANIFNPSANGNSAAPMQQQQANIFASTTSQQMQPTSVGNIFGGAVPQQMSTVLPAPAAANIFQSAAPAATGSIFSGTMMSGGFPTNSVTPFAPQQQQAQPSAAIFSNSGYQYPQQMSVIAQPQPSTMSQNIFAPTAANNTVAPTLMPTPSPFANPSPFSAPAPSVTQPQSIPSTTPFSVPVAPSGSIFSGAQQQQQPAGVTKSIFGTATVTTASTELRTFIKSSSARVATYAKSNPEYYSQELTREDEAEYLQESFTLDKVPELPPTSQLCM